MKSYSRNLQSSTNLLPVGSTSRQNTAIELGGYTKIILDEFFITNTFLPGDFPVMAEKSEVIRVDAVANDDECLREMVQEKVGNAAHLIILLLK